VTQSASWLARKRAPTNLKTIFALNCITKTNSRKLSQNIKVNCNAYECSTQELQNLQHYLSFVSTIPNTI